MENTIINLTSEPVLLTSILGVAGYTTLVTVCSAISKVMPDTILKETRFLGLRVGTIRTPYNAAMKFINKVALNSGKAENNPIKQ